MTTNLGRFLNEVEYASAETFQSEEDRVRARNATIALLNRLRTPWENMFFYGWHAPAFLGCLKMCADLDLFAKWIGEDGKNTEAKSVDELGALVGADPKLLKRVLVYLSVMGLLETKDRHVFSPTNWAVQLATPVFKHTTNFGYDVNMTGFHRLPIFLKSIGYQNPTEPEPTTFSDLFGKNIWDLHKEKPWMAVDFQTAMTGFNNSKTGWTKVYPTEDLLVDLKPLRAILVDVGGGQGSDISLFAETHPHLPKGSLVLEDLPSTIAQAKVPDLVRTQAIDAFKEQPVKGARAYYLHIVLHDFPDGDAIKILKRQAEAMERGYSKLLLYEAVLGAENESEALTSTCMDVTMLMCFGSRERSFEVWTEMLNAAGLKIVKIHNSPLAAESVIEAELI